MAGYSRFSRKTVLQGLSVLPILAGSVASANGYGTNRLSGTVNFRYMGTAAWEISDDTHVILIDPYLSRINGPPPPGVPRYSEVGDLRPVYEWDDVPVPDSATIAAHIHKADLILVTHAHYDHILDVPTIAHATGAPVIGHESTQNILRAYSVPEAQLLTVRGGEDYDFGRFSVKVIPAIHSADRKSVV